jgi:hypothetical protein
MQHDLHLPMWRTPSGIILFIFLGIAAFYLLTEHTVHVFGVLPFLLLAACPVMHLFMHHGHGGHGKTQPPVDNSSKGSGP